MAPTVGNEVSVEASSAGDISLAVVSSDGFVELFVDDSETEIEAGSFEVVVDAPHVVAVSVLSIGGEIATVRSDVPLREFIDPDHGRTIRAGETITANIDYPTDVDYFLLELAEGQTVTVEVDSMNFDADLVIDRADNTGDITFGGCTKKESEINFHIGGVISSISSVPERGKGFRGR